MDLFDNSKFELKWKVRKPVKQTIKCPSCAISSCSIRKQKHMANLSLGLLLNSQQNWKTLSQICFDDKSSVKFLQDNGIPSYPRM